MGAASTPATEPGPAGVRASRRIIAGRRSGLRRVRPPDAGQPGATQRTIAG